MADALSLQHEDSTLNAISLPQPTLLNDIHDAYGHDDALQNLIDECTKDLKPPPGYEVCDLLVFYKVG